jgi:hypothetical protein
MPMYIMDTSRNRRIVCCLHACSALGMRWTIYELAAQFWEAPGISQNRPIWGEANVLLRTEDFDLVVVSAWLSAW